MAFSLSLPDNEHIFIDMEEKLSKYFPKEWKQESGKVRQPEGQISMRGTLLWPTLRTLLCVGLIKRHSAVALMPQLCV